MRKMSKKLRRQHALKQLIKETQVSTQDELKDGLKKMGIDITQSSLSRDLNDIGIVKKHGYYHIPTVGQQSGMLPPITSLVWSGSNLLILKTYPSMAPSMGSIIDDQQISGVMGTVAGDDTVFVATATGANKEEVEKHIRRFFGN